MVLQTTPKPQTRKEQVDDEILRKQNLLKEYDISQDLNSMQTAGQKIAKLSRRRSTIIRALLPGIQEDIDSLEAHLMLEIAKWTDDKGKPLASNAETRKALLGQEMFGKKEYQDLRNHQLELQSELDQIDTDIDLERRRDAAARYQIEHKTASIKLLAL